LTALLTESASSGRGWALSSIKCCVLTVARRFGIAIGLEDPASYSPEKLLENYRRIIERAAESSIKSPARLQKTVAWALREYQRHIVCKFKANPVQETVAFRVEQGVLPVNARVLSLDDLFAVVDYIKTAPHAHWLPKYRGYAIAEAVLSFFGGVRREEGLGLAACDYLPSLVGLLLIRDNEIRTLKTPNAKRALYLSIAAYPFTELIEYVAKFFEQPQELDEPVFADLSDDLIIRIIHGAILKVTGDANCTLHSLRHSFGHWMYFRLALAQFSSTQEELFPHLNKTKI
jgi:integrase